MTLKLAWQQLLAQWRAGELRVLLLAIVVAVSAITAVNFFTNRIELHLNRESALVLGGDMVMLADHAIPKQAIAIAETMQLSHTTTAEFPSMVIVKDNNQLAEIKALQTGFPLRGDLTVQLATNQPAKTLQAVPGVGTVWIEPRLADLLKLKIGDNLTLGARDFKVSGILMREPSRGGDMFNFAPRLLMNAADLASTQLIQFGSRVRYQLLVAGQPSQVQRFQQKLVLTLKAGEKIQDLKSARPEIKSALDKAEIFLGLAAMVTLVLSVTAMLLASGPYVARNMEVAALLRCFGASRQTIQRMLLWQCSMLALIAAIIGCLLGYGLQYGLSTLAGRLFAERLPAAGMQPIGIGFLISFLVLFAIMLPNIQAIKNRAVIHILRLEIDSNLLQSGLKLLPVLGLVAALFFWIAQSWQLALMMMAGMVAICIICALLTHVLAHGLYVFSQGTYGLHSPNWQMLKIGLANLKRNRSLTITQVIGFSLSAMVLVLLMIVKNDLIQNWQASLPKNAPNRFMINIQPEQVADVQVFQKSNGVVDADVFPMVRGRLLAINGQAVSADVYQDARAKRLVSREFNLSMAAHMQIDNRLLAGRWWQPSDAGKPWISIEHDIAEALGIQVGDQLSYDIAGTQLVLTVKSIRKVEWDSLRANFFAVTPPDTLKDFPITYMTAFYLPDNQAPKLNRLLQQFPNFTVIDVASLMRQIRDIMQKMSLAIAYVFSLCVVAGGVVLYAALLATRAARTREAALLRVFGASKWQVSVAILAEYAGMAILVAVMALLVANAVAFYISHYLFDIGYQWDMGLSVMVCGLCLILIPGLAWLVVRRQLNQPPKQILHSI